MGSTARARYRRSARPWRAGPGSRDLEFDPVAGLVTVGYDPEATDPEGLARRVTEKSGMRAEVAGGGLAQVEPPQVARRGSLRRSPRARWRASAWPSPGRTPRRGPRDRRSPWPSPAAGSSWSLAPCAACGSFRLDIHVLMAPGRRRRGRPGAVGRGGGRRLPVQPVRGAGSPQPRPRPPRRSIVAGDHARDGRADRARRPCSPRPGLLDPGRRPRPRPRRRPRADRRPGRRGAIERRSGDAHGRIRPGRSRARRRGLRRHDQRRGLARRRGHEAARRGPGEPDRRAGPRGPERSGPRRAQGRAVRRDLHARRGGARGPGDDRAAAGRGRELVHLVRQRAGPAGDRLPVRPGDRHAGGRGRAPWRRRRGAAS